MRITAHCARQPVASHSGKIIEKSGKKQNFLKLRKKFFEARWYIKQKFFRKNKILLWSTDYAL